MMQILYFHFVSHSVNPMDSLFPCFFPLIVDLYIGPAHGAVTLPESKSDRVRSSFSCLLSLHCLLFLTFSFEVIKKKPYKFAYAWLFLSINCRSIYWTSARCCHIARIKKRSCPFLFFVSVVVALSIISHVLISYACLVERIRCQVACGSHLAPMHVPNGSFCVHAMQLPTSSSSSTPLSDDDLLDLPELVTINQSELLVHLHISSLAASISETGREKMLPCRLLSWSSHSSSCEALGHKPKR